jgi:hypothetical protein
MYPEARGQKTEKSTRELNVGWVEYVFTKPTSEDRSQRTEDRKKHERIKCRLG